MAGFFWEGISIAVKLFVQSICQKVIEFASDVARRILEPSSRKPALPAVTTKVVVVPPPHDHHVSSCVDLHWKTIEDKILRDIEPLAHLAKSVLHSGNYRNGDRLTEEDEKDVMENLLKYHSGFQKKIGSQFNSIVVDRHVEFEDSRCMYVVRTDGSRMDFSYRKCLRGYIDWKYPAHAKKFARSNPHLVKYSSN